MQFRLFIDCDNAAFEDEPAHELARMLRDVAKRLESGDGFDTWRDLRDVNGNVAGKAALKARDRF